MRSLGDRHTYVKMLITLKAIRNMIAEAWKTRVIDTSKKGPGDLEPRKGSIEKGKAAVAQDLDDDIESMRRTPEFKTLDSFMEYKFDDDDLTFDWIELQALARNAAERRLNKQNVVPGPKDIESVKDVLVKQMGFKFKPREPERSIRGATDNSHGTHPFAGSGGGGSGFSSDRGGGGGFTSFGGGPGAIGGKYAWKSDDSRNFPMGSRKKT